MFRSTPTTKYLSYNRHPRIKRKPSTFEYLSFNRDKIIYGSYKRL